MIVFPAIDLSGGKCVRLMRGDFAAMTVYGDDPPAMAGRWQREGGEWLHVVDLDGSLAGHPVHLETIRAICARVSIPVELGGGVRTEEHARAAFDAGVTRLILGTAALESPELLERLCGAHPGRIYVALDARDGRVAIRGWTETSDVSAADAAKISAAHGAAGILFTDISRDGTGGGVNVEATARLAEGSGIPVIASGGVASLDDVRRVRERAASGIEGVIIGRALYTGAVSLAEAIAVARGAP